MGSLVTRCLTFLSRRSIIGEEGLFYELGNKRLEKILRVKWLERVGLSILKRSSSISLLSMTLALQSLLAVLGLLDAFHVTYFPMIHRATFTRVFSLGFSLAPALLLLSSISIVYLLMGRRHWEVLVLSSISVGLYLVFGIGVSAAVFSVMLVAVALLRFRRFQDCAFWLLVLLTGFEGLALLHWILLPFGIASPLAWFADLELSLFYVAASIAPLIAAAILCMWFLRPLIEYVGIDRLLGSWLNLDSDLGDGEINVNQRAILALVLTFSVVGALYPYVPEINPSAVPVGVDVHYYLEWMAEVDRDLSSVFTAARGSRPLMLLLIFFLQRVSGLGVLEIVKYLPVLLNPLLALAVYFLVSRTTGDMAWAALASLFTALGFTTTVGMYAYFLANLLALSVNFSALALLFVAMRTGRGIYLVSALALGVLAVFTHPWTFIQYYAAVALFFGFRFFREKRFEGRNAALAFLGVTGLADLLKGALVGGVWGSGLVASTAHELSEAAGFWLGNIFAFRLLYGGLFSNVVLLLFAALGAYGLSWKEPFRLFLMGLLVASSLYYFLAEGAIQSRILFNVPLGVFAALGLLLLMEQGSLKKEFRRVLLLFAGVFMSVYLLRSLANLV